MKHEVTVAKSGPGGEARLANHEAFALARTGHLQQARQVSRIAMNAAQQAAHREKAGLFEAERRRSPGSLLRKRACCPRARQGCAVTVE